MRRVEALEQETTAVDFCTLPETGTGRIQQFVLRDVGQ
jgi:hypothetical protein